MQYLHVILVPVIDFSSQSHLPLYMSLLCRGRSPQHPARTCILALVHEGLGEASNPRTSTYRFYSVTIGFLLAAYAIALSVKDLSVMLEVVGASGSTIVSYLLPGLVYYKLHPTSHWRRHVALVQFVLGCCIIPTCLTITVRKHL